MASNASFFRMLRRHQLQFHIGAILLSIDATHHWSYRDNLDAMRPSNAAPQCVYVNMLRLRCIHCACFIVCPVTSRTNEILVLSFFYFDLFILFSLKAMYIGVILAVVCGFNGSLLLSMQSYFSHTFYLRSPKWVPCYYRYFFVFIPYCIILNVVLTFSIHTTETVVYAWAASCELRAATCTVVLCVACLGINKSCTSIVCTSRDTKKIFFNCLRRLLWYLWNFAHSYGKIYRQWAKKPKSQSDGNCGFLHPPA